MYNPYLKYLWIIFTRLFLLPCGGYCGKCETNSHRTVSPFFDVVFIYPIHANIIGIHNDTFFFEMKQKKMNNECGNIILPSSGISIVVVMWNTKEIKQEHNCGVNQVTVHINSLTCRTTKQYCEWLVKCF